MTRRKLYRDPVRQVGSGNGQQWKKVVPESGTQEEELATGSDQKKVVPESGTSGRIREQAAIGRKLYRDPVRQVGSGNRQQSEESCTGIRYVGRSREQAAIGRKLYRDPVRQVGSGNRQRSEESCTGIRYAGADMETWQR